MSPVMLLLYAACVAFFHADQKRTSFARLESSKLARLTTWIIGGVSAFTAFLLAAGQVGYELGVTYWILSGVGAGVSSIFIAALLKRWHGVSGLAAGLSALVILIFSQGG